MPGSVAHIFVGGSGHGRIEFGDRGDACVTQAILFQNALSDAVGNFGLVGVVRHFLRLTGVRQIRAFTENRSNLRVPSQSKAPAQNADVAFAGLGHNVFLDSGCQSVAIRSPEIGLCPVRAAVAGGIIMNADQNRVWSLPIRKSYPVIELYKTVIVADHQRAHASALQLRPNFLSRAKRYIFFSNKADAASSTEPSVVFAAVTSIDNYRAEVTGYSLDRSDRARCTSAKRASQQPKTDKTNHVARTIIASSSRLNRDSRENRVRRARESR